MREGTVSIAVVAAPHGRGSAAEIPKVAAAALEAAPPRRRLPSQDTGAAPASGVDDVGVGDRARAFEGGLDDAHARELVDFFLAEALRGRGREGVFF